MVDGATRLISNIKKNIMPTFSWGKIYPRAS